jgi:serine/threonine protein kinase
MKEHLASDVLKGMAYLESRHVLHRDLAARNVLLLSDLTCKVSDFGLSVFLSKRPSTSAAVCEIEGGGASAPETGMENGSQIDESIYETFLVDSSVDVLPIRWCAPEVMATQKFSHASDVWSFGVVVWEILANGQTPWAGFSNLEVMKSVFAGNTQDPYAGLRGREDVSNAAGVNSRQEQMAPPDVSTRLERIASAIRSCWAFKMEQRATFTSMLPILQRQQESIFQLHKTNSVDSRLQRGQVLGLGPEVLYQPLDADLVPVNVDGSSNHEYQPTWPRQNHRSRGDSDVGGGDGGSGAASHCRRTLCAPSHPSVGAAPPSGDSGDDGDSAARSLAYNNVAMLRDENDRHAPSPQGRFWSSVALYQEGGSDGAERTPERQNTDVVSPSDEVCNTATSAAAAESYTNGGGRSTSENEPHARLSSGQIGSGSVTGLRPQRAASRPALETILQSPNRTGDNSDDDDGGQINSDDDDGGQINSDDDGSGQEKSDDDGDVRVNSSGGGGGQENSDDDGGDQANSDDAGGGTAIPGGSSTARGLGSPNVPALISNRLPTARRKAAEADGRSATATDDPSTPLQPEVDDATPRSTGNRVTSQLRAPAPQPDPTVPIATVACVTLV